ncbi:MAG: helix-hairpin-helix domain-containing protein [Clostridia bacterium]|nr:helix-hairpin-helix domain-containing protein [Clostridia bacterium]
MGASRAAALMRHFKTTKALRAATAEELAAAPGMNAKAAAALREWLDQEENR